MFFILSFGIKKTHFHGTRMSDEDNSLKMCIEFLLEKSDVFLCFFSGSIDLYEQYCDCFPCCHWPEDM